MNYIILALLLYWCKPMRPLVELMLLWAFLSFVFGSAAPVHG